MTTPSHPTGAGGRSSAQTSGDESVLVVGAAVVDDLDRPTRLLAARRTEPPALAGGWELPGGKVDPGETPQQALHRELEEELGVTVELGDAVPGPLPDASWPLGPGYRMLVWLAVVTGGVPTALEDHDQLRWLEQPALDDVAWLPGDLPIVRAVAWSEPQPNPETLGP